MSRAAVWAFRRIATGAFLLSAGLCLYGVAYPHYVVRDSLHPPTSPPPDRPSRYESEEYSRFGSLQDGYDFVDGGYYAAPLVFTLVAMLVSWCIPAGRAPDAATLDALRDTLDLQTAMDLLRYPDDEVQHAAATAIIYVLNAADSREIRQLPPHTADDLYACLNLRHAITRFPLIFAIARASRRAQDTRAIPYLRAMLERPFRSNEEECAQAEARGALARLEPLIENARERSVLLRPAPPLDESLLRPARHAPQRDEDERLLVRPHTSDGADQPGA